MSSTFKLRPDEYKSDITTFRSSSEKVEPSVAVSRMSVCSDLIIDAYVDRLESIGELLIRYVELVKKDTKEFSTITDDIVQQESQWAATISNTQQAAQQAAQSP